MEVLVKTERKRNKTTKQAQ